MPVVHHFNQLLHQARGKYFVLLCDDDEISPDFVSDLAGLLEEHPEANVAVPRPVTFDSAGNVRQYPSEWPDLLTGGEFIRAWASKRVRLLSTVTVMARTAVARTRGGYPELPRALYSDNVFLSRLALDSHVVLARRAIFRWRIDDASTGFSAPYTDVAAACHGFFRYLDSDEQWGTFPAARPAEWRELRRILRDQCARWFFFRWKERYWPNLGVVAGLRAAFSLRPIRSYYALLGEELLNVARSYVRQRLGNRTPGAQRARITAHGGARRGTSG